MKKQLAVLMATALLSALCACKAPQPVEPAESITIPTAVETSAPEAVIPANLSGEAGDEPVRQGEEDDLTALLQHISEFYQPGTAGCSLQAAKYAGMLLDWNAAAGWSADAIAATTADFCGKLPSEGASLFSSQQLGGVYDAAGALLADTALDYLDSAGYQLTAYPWAQGTVDTLFAALFEGVGRELPA